MLNRFTAAAAGLFAAGLALVATSIVNGEGRAGIAVFVPFFVGTGPLASLGVLCFFAGMVLLFLGLAGGPRDVADREGPKPPEGAGVVPGGPAGPVWRTRAGGVILVGPIPVVFGSDPGISRAMFYIAVALMAALVAALVALAVL